MTALDGLPHIPIARLTPNRMNRVSLILSEARKVLIAESDAIRAASSRLGPEFALAVQCLAEAHRIHVVGVGKSGHVARKIAGTMTSTGSPAGFLHPTEALHGDIGGVLANDTAILISRSGECEEVLACAHELRHRVTTLVAITGSVTSRLAELCDVVLDCTVDAEADPNGLAPTASTAAALAMGDALAMALMQRHGFTPEDFKDSHPGGVLGRAVLR